MRGQDLTWKERFFGSMSVTIWMTILFCWYNLLYAFVPLADYYVNAERTIDKWVQKQLKIWYRRHREYIILDSI